MKNSLLALAMSVALSMSAAAHAQTTQLKVAVPFDFMAGDTVLPAGDYDVQSTDTWGGKALSFCISGWQGYWFRCTRWREVRQA